VGVGEIDEPVVRDRDPMRVLSQIVKHVFGAAEGALRIYQPVFAEQRPQKPPKGGCVRERKAGAMERELVPAKRAPEARHKLAAENAAQDSHREKEARSRSDPPFPIRG
jgi:hypothetical protein